MLAEANAGKSPYTLALLDFHDSMGHLLLIEELAYALGLCRLPRSEVNVTAAMVTSPPGVDTLPFSLFGQATNKHTDELMFSGLTVELDCLHILK